MRQQLNNTTSQARSYNKVLDILASTKRAKPNKATTTPLFIRANHLTIYKELTV